MKTFTYQARDNATNKIIKSTIKAETEIIAGKLLMDQGLIPLSIKESSENKSILARLTGKIKLKDKLVFTRQLATLISAGLPLSQSLRTVYDQTEHKGLKSIIGEVVASVEGGRSLSDSFAKYPEVFDSLFIALLSAGEASGTLDEALIRVADQQEKDAALMKKVRGAMTYPIIVLVVIGAVLAFMMFTVMPQVEGLYRDMRLTLPFVTRVMVAFANFMTKFWWLIIVILAIGIYFFRQYLRTEAGIKFKDSFKLNVPLFKGMFRKMYMARFARTGETLLGTGVPMLDTLDLSAQSVNNTIISCSIKNAADKVKGGKALSASLRAEEYILPLIPQMIKIGEQSGKIDEMMGKAAQVYEEELDEEIKNLTTAIEPILMVILAVVAGAMVAAILLPIYSMVGNVRV